MGWKKFYNFYLKPENKADWIFSIVVGIGGIVAIILVGIFLYIDFIK